MCVAACRDLLVVWSAHLTAKACICAWTPSASQSHNHSSDESLLYCLQGPANGIPNVAIRFDYMSTEPGYTPLFRCEPASMAVFSLAAHAVAEPSAASLKGCEACTLHA